MAQPGLSLAIGDALLAVVDWAWPRVAPRVDDLFERIADVLRPDPPLSIRSLEGHLLTGLIIADRGHVPLVLGALHSTALDATAKNDAAKQAAIGGLIALGVGSLIFYLLTREQS